MHIDLPEKRYYSIGEVAKAFGVNTSLLRFWEKEFDQIKPKKKQSGIRKYTPEDVKSIQLVYHLVKEKGLTIDGAKKQLKMQSQDDPKTVLLEKLQKLKADLERFRDQL
ncbi:MAG: MerR family transcriptional regulator [Flavobacteriaceae bacterium TMED120]|jgi:DNA-binding transcriptional MerR regulator|nr:MAG: MerR family transcriptional regulator [Flavobacteriaceae bacterium TMED120]CAI8214788.1 MAG: HTH-type transcriptional repressor BluR [Flavobacteriaceae bacterium]HCQ24364.1 transcriptional regulator [Flavobacteriaceae bacterium]|tara:strand:+ start:1150 stop:1476 length:327 start_codon:yes stop_codon:yes gene_type:complete